MSEILTALFGAPLIGDRWVKMIHVDESGTSRSERVAVVAGIIFDGDRDFALAEAGIGKAIADHIPEDMREGFVFHAKEIFGKHRKERGWSLSTCNEIVEAWLAIVRDLRVPVALAWCTKRDMEEQRGRFYFTEESNRMAHAMAFTLCFDKCDLYLDRECAGEVASLIAEDVPQMKATLRRVIKDVRDGVFRGFPPFNDRPIQHIKNAVQWCDKNEAVLLQLADAYAWSFRRYMGGKPDGTRLFHFLRGGPEVLYSKDWTNTPVGSFILDWRPQMTAS